MPVGDQNSTTFPRPQPFWWHERPVKLETLGGSNPPRNTAFPANAHVAWRVLVLANRQCTCREPNSAEFLCGEPQLPNSQPTITLLANLILPQKSDGLRNAPC
jgi:hypothetical protein